MIEILGVHLTVEALTAIGAAISGIALSDGIGLSKSKYNSVIEVLYALLRGMRPKNKQREELQVLIQEIRGLEERLEAGSKQAQEILEKKIKPDETTRGR